MQATVRWRVKGESAPKTAPHKDLAEALLYADELLQAPNVESLSIDDPSGSTLEGQELLDTIEKAKGRRAPPGP